MPAEREQVEAKDTKHSEAHSASQDVGHRLLEDTPFGQAPNSSNEEQIRRHPAPSFEPSTSASKQHTHGNPFDDAKNDNKNGESSSSKEHTWGNPFVNAPMSDNPKNEGATSATKQHSEGNPFANAPMSDNPKNEGATSATKQHSEGNPFADQKIAVGQKAELGQNSNIVIGDTPPPTRPMPPDFRPPISTPNSKMPPEFPRSETDNIEKDPTGLNKPHGRSPLDPIPPIRKDNYEMTEGAKKKLFSTEKKQYYPNLELF